MPLMYSELKKESLRSLLRDLTFSCSCNDCVKPRVTYVILQSILSLILILFIHHLHIPCHSDRNCRYLSQSVLLLVRSRGTERDPGRDGIQDETTRFFFSQKDQLFKYCRTGRFFFSKDHGIEPTLVKTDGGSLLAKTEQ